MKNFFKTNKLPKIIVLVIIIIPTIFMIALQTNSTMLKEFLEDHGYKIVSTEDSSRNKPNKNQPKKINYNTMNQQELCTAFLNNVSKKNVDECDLILSSGLDVNFKDVTGQTLYSKTINLILDSIKDFSYLNDEVSIIDKMRSKGANDILVKVNNKSNLNKNQKNFLNRIHIDIRTEEEKRIDTQKYLDKLKKDHSKKANENFSMNGLELLKCSTTSDGSYIIGKIKNNNSFTCSYVEVAAKITDTNGNVLDTPIDNITNLQSGETWSFKIPVLVDTEKRYNYQIIEMNCN